MRIRVNQTLIAVAVTALVFAVLFGAASIRYTGFFSWRVFADLLADNAFLGISAVGMTFVILSGGIDLSVGSVLALASVLIAVLTEQYHLPGVVAIPLVLAMGTLLGTGMGCLIWFFDLAPFLVTLAGMFLARGAGFLVSVESIPVSDSLLRTWAGLPMPTFLFLGTLAAGIYVASFTPFGRNVYALGGNEQSATLMGLPVGFTKIAVYSLNGFCSALAGVVFTIYTLSGNPRAAIGLELDAIAAVVIGGTLLSGGVGHVAGTLIGVLILGVIQTAIVFEGTLSSWWTKIAIGLLLFTFVVLQRFLSGGLRRRQSAGGMRVAVST